MSELIGFDREGRILVSGDKVTDFRGKERTYEYATREARPGKSAKVLVDGRESNAEAFGITVTDPTVTDDYRLVDYDE